MSLLNWLTKTNVNPIDDSLVSTQAIIKASSNEAETVSTEFNCNTNNSSNNSNESGDKNDNDYPSIWTNEMFLSFLNKYPWIMVKDQKLGCNICVQVQNLATYKTQGIRFAIEWTECSVHTYGASDKDKRQSLRKKIHKHKISECHKRCEQILKAQEENILPKAVSRGISGKFESTIRVFNTVYSIVKKTRPFTDLPFDIQLQKLNGLDMGRILHSDHACADIASHIAIEMKTKITNFLVKNNFKISVLIDEATSVSKKTCLVVCIRASTDVKNETDPITFFLDLIELENTKSETIVLQLLSSLNKHKFSHEYLIQNFICFACDGASNMIGRKAGVGKLLTDKYPDLLVWHCSNHRLELAVDDVVNEVAGINHFKIFFDTLYALYSSSPKNQYGLKSCSKELDLQFLSIGRILNTRWVASSLRSVKAVWRNYEALYLHFNKCSLDSSRTSKEKATFKGLKHKITSTDFVLNLGLLYDALTELSDLSLELQKRCTKLPDAHNLIRRQILIFESMSEKCNDGFYKEAENSECSLTFKNIELHENNKNKINYKQFYRSLADNLKSRMLNFTSSHVSSSSDTSNKYAEFIQLLEVLNPQKWPLEVDILYGERAIKQLSNIFKINERESVRGFREYIDNKSVIPDNLKPLTQAVNTLVVSTAECERLFSAMNIVHNDTRNTLEVSRVSDLLWIKCVGPPLCEFYANTYVESWVSKGRRCADHTQCISKQEIRYNTEYNSLWEQLK